MGGWLIILLVPRPTTFNLRRPSLQNGSPPSTQYSNRRTKKHPTHDPDSFRERAVTFAELRDDTHGDKSKKANEEAEESEKEV
jgi:hypothetical protein